MVKKLIPSATLQIIGDGPLRRKLEELTINLNLTTDVTFIGRTTNVQQYLSDWDIFVLTSKYEGFGLVLLEAMSLNVPIVASNNSAIPEVLGEDFPGLCKSGEASEFARKIIELTHPNQRDNFLLLQNRRSSLFSARKMRQNIDLVYSGK
jgi:glycosyltransferase involved in cell wall biosynthesis